MPTLVFVVVASLMWTVMVIRLLTVTMSALKMLPRLPALASVVVAPLILPLVCVLAPTVLLLMPSASATLVHVVAIPLRLIRIPTVLLTVLITVLLMELRLSLALAAVASLR